MKTCCSDFFLPPRTRRTARGGAKTPTRQPRGRGASGAPPKRRPRAVHNEAVPPTGGGGRRTRQPRERVSVLSMPREARRVSGRSALTKANAEPAQRGAAIRAKCERARELNAPVARCETHARDTEACGSDSPRMRGREATHERDAEAARQTCKQSSSAQTGIHCFVWWNRATPERDCICISSVSQGR